MYLFDTDTLSNLISKRPSARLLSKLAHVSPKEQFTSAITVGEIYYGVHKSPRANDLKERLEKLVWPKVQIISFDRKAAEVYGQVRAELEKSGKPLAEADLMIAGISLSRNLALITGNIKHFGRVKGLKVENWL